MSYMIFHSWHQWCWHRHHVMLTLLPVAPLCFLDQDDQTKVQHYTFGHLIPMVLSQASCDAYTAICGTIDFLWSKWLKWGETWFYLVMWCHWQWSHYISYIKTIEMRCNMTDFGYLIPLALALEDNQIRWIMTFLSYDTIDTSVGIQWCQWYHKQQYCSCLVKMI